MNDMNPELLARFHLATEEWADTPATLQRRMEDQFKVEQFNAKSKALEIRQGKHKHLDFGNLWDGNKLRVLYISRDLGWDVYHWRSRKFHGATADDAIEWARRFQLSLDRTKSERAEKQRRPCSVPLRSQYEIQTQNTATAV